MRLASLNLGGRDGALIVVSSDNQRYLSAAKIAPTLQAALDDWSKVAPQLQELSANLITGGESLREEQLMAPLPRAWQWLDGSAFASHGALMEKVLGIPPLKSDLPLMYQGLSNQFLSPREDAHFPDEALGIDFEGEFAVVLDAVPMGISAARAVIGGGDCVKQRLQKIRPGCVGRTEAIVQIEDVRADHQLPATPVC